MRDQIVVFPCIFQACHDAVGHSMLIAVDAAAVGTGIMRDRDRSFNFDIDDMILQIDSESP